MAHFRVPASTLATDGSTRRFTIFFRDGDADPVLTLRCVVPNTDAAVSFALSGITQDAPPASARIVPRTAFTPSFAYGGGTQGLPAVYVYAAFQAPGGFSWGYGYDSSQGDRGGGEFDTYDESGPIVPVADPSDDAEPPYRPDCTHPSTRKEEAFCSGSAPSGDRLTRIRSALDVMRGKSAICAQLADLAESLMATDAIHIYDGSMYPDFGGGGPLGAGVGGWIALSSAWTDAYYDAAHPTPNDIPPRDLSHSLAHELDHLLGYGHVVAGGVEDPRNTPHSMACSDLAP